jgi:hypothetical protein
VRFMRFLRTFGPIVALRRRSFHLIFLLSSLLIRLQYSLSHSLRTTRNVYIDKHFFKLVQAGVDNPPTLAEIGFWVPERHQPSRFIPVGARTRVLSDASLTRANSLLNRLSEEIEDFVRAIRMVAQEWRLTNEHESIK